MTTDPNGPETAPTTAQKTPATAPHAREQAQDGLYPSMCGGCIAVYWLNHACDRRTVSRKMQKKLGVRHLESVTA